MGRLLDGKWIQQDLGTDAEGRYVRQVTQFRHKFTAGNTPSSSDDKTDDETTDSTTTFPVPNKDDQRYLLLVGSPCGWSHRVLLVRALKGLESCIPVIFTDAFMGEDGWTFDGHTQEKEDNNEVDDGDKKRPAKVRKVDDKKEHQDSKGKEKETEQKKGGGLTAQELYLDPSSAGYSDGNQTIVTKLHELYVLAKSDYTGRASVPVLWDRQLGTIVNNESSELVVMLNALPSSTKTLLGEISPDLQAQIQDMTDTNYTAINNGVYKCGFANSQEAYTEAATALFERLDELEALLGRQRYLCSTDKPTMADVCLFPTLFRFDMIYYTHFKCNHKHIYEYPNLWGWTREMYQLPGVAATCKMNECCIHYYTSHESIHPRRYIPLGPTLDFEALHRRDEFAYKA